ncbi:hypothetical protein B0T14DRAFT_529119 [Immersiella caudata]|uniref:Uncharacterized protein n=1 Tax=Immersiella caudata TaxID=314043 RepID=A0AA39U4D6_9PEZI|nr:hypothetical protein B0T14DRAFT_529119 [Immersiella caudata]
MLVCVNVGMEGDVESRKSSTSHAKASTDEIPRYPSPFHTLPPAGASPGGDGRPWKHRLIPLLLPQRHSDRWYHRGPKTRS